MIQKKLHSSYELHGLTKTRCLLFSGCDQAAGRCQQSKKRFQLRIKTLNRNPSPLCRLLSIAPCIRTSRGEAEVFLQELVSIFLRALVQRVIRIIEFRLFRA
jgi:hypothetical protein